MRRLGYIKTLLALAAGQALAAAAGEEAGAARFGPPLEGVQLEELRAGSALTASDMRLSGTTAGNTASQVATGSNTITEGAFSHLSGIPLVVQNSGANVLIQNAVIVNLQLQ